MRFLFLPRLSSHVMPAWTGALAGIYGARLPHPASSRQRTTPPPLVVMADPHSANAERHLLRSWVSLLSSLRVIARRNDEAIHLCQIDVRFNYVECRAFVSKKTSISFPIIYPTANDYSRLQTFIQRLNLDKGCIFVV